jgi:hypothetical protein
MCHEGEAIVMFRKEAIDVDDDGSERERENLLDKEAKKSGHHPKLSRVESVEIMENYVFIMGQGGGWGSDK